MATGTSRSPSTTRGTSTTERAAPLDGANIPLLLAGPAKVTFSYDDTTHLVTVHARSSTSDTTPADASLAAASLRDALTRERFYFVMADRFANGRPPTTAAASPADR